MGALRSWRVIELASDATAFAGKLLADLGADVIVVEPPEGCHQRRYGPFLDDEAGPERSLHWWHYNTSKRGIVLDLDDVAPGGGRDTLVRLVADAGVVLEGEPPGRLADRGLDYPALRRRRADLIHCSVTPFGLDGPRSKEAATDLTLLAGAGPVWSCGYDDHALPPVRGGGHQGHHTGGVWAAIATLTAILHRAHTGVGQHLDVSQHAASNVTTEAATYLWHVAGKEVQRQTGRHASQRPTDESQILCGDGRWLNAVVPPRRPTEFRMLRDWLVELGLSESFEGTALLEEAGAYDHIGMAELRDAPQLRDVFSTARAAVARIAAALPALEVFEGFQQRGFAVGAILAPEDVMTNRHFVERGFPVAVEHEELGRSVLYPGVPVRLNGSPARIAHRAPRLGEHTEEVLAALPPG